MEEQTQEEQTQYQGIVGKWTLDSTRRTLRSPMGVNLSGSFREFEREFVRVEFERLAAQWRRERNPISSADEELFAESQPYQQIVGLGTPVVPFLLQELRKREEPEPWFWALAAITRTNPVPPEARGKLRETAEAWVLWGFRTRLLLE
jgi:hypothetical protein